MINFVRASEAVPDRLITAEPLRVGPAGHSTIRLSTADGRMVVAEVVRGFHQDAPRLARLLAAAPAMAAVLRAVEWGGTDESPDPDLEALRVCPTCEGVAPGQGAPEEVTGHDEGCELARALAMVATP